MATRRTHATCGWMLARATVATGVLAMLSAGCSRQGSGANVTPPYVVATTTMLGVMVDDVTGGAVPVHSLVPPGSCPGHFDATPRDLDKVAGSRLVLRHDFQAHLDAKLSRGSVGQVTVVSVTSTGPQTLPDHYLNACTEVADALARAFPEQAHTWTQRLDRVRRRVRRTERQVRAIAGARLRGQAVVASHWQAGLCRWAGLDVVGTFDHQDQMSVADLSRLVADARRAGVCAVVGHVQRGTRQAKVIAERLGVPVAVLSNFPDPSAGQHTYDDLLRTNIEHLAEVMGGE